MKFSQMFLDFCEEKEFFNDRFPMNKSIFSSSNTLEKISYGNVKRTKFIEVIEKRQGLKVACLEGIAFRKGWITADQLRELAKPMLKNQYGQYLLKLAEEF